MSSEVVTATCGEEGCNDPATRRGLCPKHYMRFYRSKGASVAVEAAPRVNGAAQEERQMATSSTIEGTEEVGVAAEMLAQAIAALRPAGPAVPEGLIERLDGVDLRLSEHHDLVAGLFAEIETLRNRANPVLTIEIKAGQDVTRKIDGIFHRDFPSLVKLASLRHHVFLVGPAGSGKTTLAGQVAKALELDFYFTGALLQKYELLGYMDATGRYIGTSFRRAYEFGGLFLWDEVDSSDAAALVAFNAALEQDQADFPDGMVKRHPNFVAMAAGNTYGRGADRVYVGRTQLDGATLDRFTVWTLDYDEDLERALAGNDPWVSRVQAFRAAAQRLGIRHIISPRASIKGAAQLKAGFTREQVEDMTVFKGLDPAQVRKIREAA